MSHDAKAILEELQAELPDDAPSNQPLKHYVADTNAAVRGFLHQRKEPLDQIKDWYIEIVTPHANFDGLWFEDEKLPHLQWVDGKVAVFGSALREYRERILRAKGVKDHKSLRSKIEHVYSRPSLSFKFHVSYSNEGKYLTHYRLWYGQDIYLDRVEDTGHHMTFGSFDHVIHRNWVTDNLQLTSFPGSDCKTTLFP